jgi:hypothetical protein
LEEQRLFIKAENRVSQALNPELISAQSMVDSIHMDQSPKVIVEAAKATAQSIVPLSDAQLMALMFLALVVLMWKVLDLLKRK